MRPSVRYSSAIVRRLVALVAVLLLASPHGAFAQTADAPRAAPTPEAVARAKAHFDRARELYRDGAYREALRENETARALDPTAKQLVYNAAVLHEKLGELELALQAIDQFAKMNLDAAERERAQSFRRRLDGAKRETAPASRPPQSAPPPKEEDDDAATGATGTPPATTRAPVAEPDSGVAPEVIVVGGVAVAAFAVGTLFGVRAVSDRPTGFVTGSDGTYADYQARSSKARREAVIADVAIAGGVVATVAAVYLYVTRKNAAPAPAPTAATLSVSPLRDGAALLMGGRF